MPDEPTELATAIWRAIGEWMVTDWSDEDPGPRAVIDAAGVAEMAAENEALREELAAEHASVAEQPPSRINVAELVAENEMLEQDRRELHAENERLADALELELRKGADG